MIIYGYRNREIEKGTGSFYCPKCEAQRQYKHKKIVRYFTLFFIPLFPLGTLSEYVECGVCGRTYKPEILSIPSTIGRTAAAQSMVDSTSQSFLQSAAVDQPQPASAPKGNSCLPWVLILGGAFLFIFGSLMCIALIITQFDSSGALDIASFILAIIICPTPLALLGAIAIGGGVYMLRKGKEPNPNTL